MIRGEFNGNRPLMSGLLLFSFSSTYVKAKFLVDSGADVSLVSADDYLRAGFRYDDFRTYPAATSSGFGGAIQARRVPAKLFLFDHDAETVRQLALEIEVVRPPLPTDGRLPSIIGRDVTDLFRLVIDRSIDLVALDECMGGGWPP